MAAAIVTAKIKRRIIERLLSGSSDAPHRYGAADIFCSTVESAIDSSAIEGICDNTGVTRQFVGTV